VASYRTWDIVVVPFPFTDSPNAKASKVRPAVIVSTDVLSRRNGKYVLAMVTSAANAAHYGDVVIKDLKAAGLPAPSVVRPSKLAVVEDGDIHKRVGTVALADRVRVAKQLREYLAVDN
jgi:mRNA interferase MazF